MSRFQCIYERISFTFLIIADFDPLPDEGWAYGLRLFREGVPTYIKWFSSIHGFYDFQELDVRKEAISYISSSLSDAFGKQCIRPSSVTTFLEG